MKFETGEVVLAVVFFVLGWLACTGWDALCDWVAEKTGHASSMVGDVFALIGAVTVAVGIGYWVTN